MNICFKTFDCDLHKNMALGKNNSKYSNLSQLRKDTVSFGTNELEMFNCVGRERGEKNGLNELKVQRLLNSLGMIDKQNKDGKYILKFYSQPSKNMKWKNIGIDETNLLNHIIEIKGNADFSSSDANNLGNLEKIGGSATFRDSKIENLNNLKEIGEDANFDHSNVNDLGQLKEIGGNAKFELSKVESLGQLKKIGNDADFSFSKVDDLGELQKIGGNAYFWNSKISDLGKLKHIGNSAYILYSNISSDDIKDKGISCNIIC